MQEYKNIVSIILAILLPASLYLQNFIKDILGGKGNSSKHILAFLITGILIFILQYYLPHFLTRWRFVKRLIFGKKRFVEGAWLHFVSDSSNNILSVSHCTIAFTANGIQHAGDNYTLDGKVLHGSFDSKLAHYIGRDLQYIHEWKKKGKMVPEIGYGYISFDSGSSIRSTGEFNSFTNRKSLSFRGYKLDKEDAKQWLDANPEKREAIISKINRKI